MSAPPSKRTPKSRGRSFETSSEDDSSSDASTAKGMVVAVSKSEKKVASSTKRTFLTSSEEEDSDDEDDDESGTIGAKGTPVGKSKKRRSFESDSEDSDEEMEGAKNQKKESSSETEESGDESSGSSSGWESDKEKSWRARRAAAAAGEIVAKSAEEVAASRVKRVLVGGWDISNFSEEAQSKIGKRVKQFQEVRESAHPTNSFVEENDPNAPIPVESLLQATLGTTDITWAPAALASAGCKGGVDALAGAEVDPHGNLLEAKCGCGEPIKNHGIQLNLPAPHESGGHNLFTIYQLVTAIRVISGSLLQGNWMDAVAGALKKMCNRFSADSVPVAPKRGVKLSANRLAHFSREILAKVCNFCKEIEGRAQNSMSEGREYGELAAAATACDRIYMELYTHSVSLFGRGSSYNALAGVPEDPSAGGNVDSSGAPMRPVHVWEYQRPSPVPAPEAHFLFLETCVPGVRAACVATIRSAVEESTLEPGKVSSELLTTVRERIARQGLEGAGTWSRVALGASGGMSSTLQVQRAVWALQVWFLHKSGLGNALEPSLSLKDQVSRFTMKRAVKGAKVRPAKKTALRGPHGVRGFLCEASGFPAQLLDQSAALRHSVSSQYGPALVGTGAAEFIAEQTPLMSTHAGVGHLEHCLVSEFGAAVNGNDVYDNTPWRAYGHHPLHRTVPSFDLVHRLPAVSSEVSMDFQGRALLLAFPPAEALLQSSDAKKSLASKAAKAGTKDSAELVAGILEEKRKSREKKVRKARRQEAVREARIVAEDAGEFFDEAKFEAYDKEKNDGEEEIPPLSFVKDPPSSWRGVEALNKFSGRTVVYIGEGGGVPMTACGGPALRKALKKDFSLVGYCGLPNWSQECAGVYVWDRKGRERTPAISSPHGCSGCGSMGVKGAQLYSCGACREVVVCSAECLSKIQESHAAIHRLQLIPALNTQGAEWPPTPLFIAVPPQ